MATLARSGGLAIKTISGASPKTNFVAVAPASTGVSAVQNASIELHTENGRPAVSQGPTGGVFASGFATKGINVSSKRHAHTDVTFPDFNAYRPESTKNVDKAARDSEDDRRALPATLYYGAGGVLSLWAGKEIVQTLVSYKAMAADQRALASIEINMNDVPEGQTKTFEWRGKPVFVKHRTKKEIATEKAVVVGDLRHPQHDDERVQKDEWSVVIGVCTHLGCVPIANAGDFGGYYCPCHGSHYDGSGRIRKGPAPLNLHVPAYSFKDKTIIIGSS